MEVAGYRICGSRKNSASAYGWRQVAACTGQCLRLLVDAPVNRAERFDGSEHDGRAALLIGGETFAA